MLGGSIGGGHDGVEEHQGGAKLQRFRISERVNMSGQVQLLPSGYNTDVSLIVRDNGDKEVVKVIGVKKSLSDEAAAREFIFDVITYRNCLAVRGSEHIPEISDAYLLQNKVENRWQVVYHMPYVGKDVAEVIVGAEDFEDIKDVLEKMLELLNIFLADRHLEPYEINVGVDPKPANFSIFRGKIFFFDFVPPRYRKGNKAIVEYPMPTTPQGYELGYFKHFDIRGVLLILQSQLSRLRSEWRDSFKALIIEKAPDCAKDFLRNGLWNLFPDFSHRRAKRVIASFTDRDIYTMREMVADLALRRGYSSDDVDRFFRLSHFEDGIEQDRLTQLKGVLLTMHKGKPLNWT